jgi:CRP-like cAMP-binding protein
MRVDVDRPRLAEAIDVLNVFGSIDFFSELGLARARELLLFAKRRHVEAGQTIIAQDSEGHEFFVIVQGSVSVERDGQYIKSYHSGEYFGETALVLNQPRTADVVARTPVELLTLDRHAFLYLLRGTDIPLRLVRLARAREARCFELFGLNSALRQLSGPQKTQLQTYVDRVELHAGDVLWKVGDAVDAAFVLDEGHVRIDPQDGGAARPDPYGQATLFAFVDAMQERRPHDTTARVLTDGHAFRIASGDLLKFLQGNPGVLLSLLGRQVTE